MKRTTLLLLWLLTICFSAIRSDALTIPASEDSWSYNGQNDKLTLSGNNANNLVVDAKRRAYLYFDLGDVPSSAVVRWAKLRLFLPVVQRAGNGLSVHSVTSEWNESKASNLPTVSTGTLGIITPDKMASRRFVTVDVTSTVQQWISGGTLNEGFAVQPIVKAGNQTASVVLTSKEGAVFGLPAELDIEFQPEGGVNKPVTLDQLPSEMRALLNPAPPTLTAESQLPQSVRNLLGSLSGAFTPKMTTQPDLSQGAQLFATAENSLDPLVRYQWLRNGVPILTGTESSLRRAGLAGGTYQVRASNTVSGTNSVSVVVPDNGHEVVFIPNTGVLFSKYETTVGQWKAFVEETGWSKSDAWRMPANEGQTDFIQDDFHPVIKVSWDDSTDYCQWLSRKTGKLFRLPSESEWMTAVPTEYPWGTSFPPSASKGNYAMDAEGRRDWPRGGIDGFKFTAPVGTFSPDHRGLFDISGNIWEWLKDNVVDRGASKKMFTGGSWNDVPSDSSSPSDVSSNRRGIESASFKNNNVGFRVVRDWLNEGLVAHYPFNGNANDESGNQNDLTVYGATLAVDRFGKLASCYHINNGQYLQTERLSFLLDPKKNFTFSILVNIQAIDAQYPQLMHLTDGISGSWEPMRMHFTVDHADNNDRLGFALNWGQDTNQYSWGAAGTATVISDNPFSTGVWRQIVGVVSSDEAKTRLYIDGHQIGEAAFSSNAPVTNPTKLILGHWYSAFLSNYTCDDVRIYNRALSEQEVKALYQIEKTETISTYQFVQGNFTWHQAKADAESKGGHLGVITSQAEWTNIVTQLGANAGKPMWIGAFQESGAQSITSGWRWITEEPFDYTAWFQGEPNGGANPQGFAHVNHGHAPYASGLWNDTSSNEWSMEGYLLEIETNASEVPPSITAQPSVSTDGAKISVQADGTGKLTYQWMRNGVAVSGGTSSQLPTEDLESGTYTVVVSNGFAIKTSAGIQYPSPIGTFALVTGGTLPASSQLGTVPVETFYIGRTEVTWKEWVTVRDWAVVNGYDDLAGVGQGVGDNYPVTYVNWYDVVKWCNARSEKEGKTPVYKNGTDVYRTGAVSDPQVAAAANGYRLPQEQEWEHAARGGTQTQGYTYSGSNDLNAVGWYGENSGGAVKEVGKKQANELGIYDMSGNMDEWCRSWVSGGEGSSRVLRGGSRWNSEGGCTVASRFYDVPGGYGNGFRVALSSVP